MHDLSLWHRLFILTKHERKRFVSNQVRYKLIYVINIAFKRLYKSSAVNIKILIYKF